MKKYLVDSIHNEIIFESKIIYDLIFTKEMQRLKKIKQLGGAHFIFPSAEHSRYIHSLGSYELTRRLLLRISHYKITDFQRDAVLLSSLLHDIGHGPFSHTFEFICPDFNHENEAIKIINNKNSEINKLITKHNPKLISEITLIISRKHKIPWLYQIISSQLDSDRLDYLMRDSMIAGPRYGNIEINRLFNTIMIKDNHLMFDKKAKAAIESFLIGRHHMYEILYMHPKNIGFDYLLIFIFNRLRYLEKNDYKFKNSITELLRVLDCNINTDDLQKLTDNSLMQYLEVLENENDKILSDLIKLLKSGKVLKYKEFDSKLSMDQFALKNNKKTQGMTWDVAEFEFGHLYKSGGKSDFNKKEILIYDCDQDKIHKLSELSEIILILSNKQKSYKKRYIFYYE